MTDSRTPDLLAAEFALGVLDGPELAEAERRLTADVPFAESVEWWRGQLAPMAAGPEEAPPASVWERIVSRLPANDDRTHPSIERAVARWRAIAAAAMAVAAALLAVLLLRPPPVPLAPPAPPPAAPAPKPVLVAVLGAAAEPARLTISIDRTSGTMLVVPVELPRDARVPELWVIPADGTPRSLGLIDRSNPRRLPIGAPNLRYLDRGATLAVSLEPAGGSPTGAPTGPVIASGKIGSA